jgi:redox-sensitive bicupin YhaK (pirin superfamily)
VLAGSTALAVAGVLGCRSSTSPSPSPAIVSLTQRRVARVLSGMATTDGAGVHLTRILGQPALRHLDPFVLLDRIHSDDPDAYVRGFPDHPHRGFETVTVMLEGRMRHRDSRGNHGLITGGGAQWMTAGRGIVHSEMPEAMPEAEQGRGTLHGFQLWVNLPAREKMCPQYYQDLSPGQLAEASLSSGGSRVRVVSGHANGVTGPLRDRPTAPSLLTLSLADDTPFELELPAGHTAFVFVHAGAVDVGADGASTRLGEGSIAVLGEGNRVRIRAPEQTSGVLLAAGRPLGEPIVQRGPFVMNTEGEIQRAWADYRAGVLDRDG